MLGLGVGCATTRVVHLDTGHGEPITYTSVGVDPVEVSEAEFKVALTRLLLDMRMDVAFRESEEAGLHCEVGGADGTSLLLGPNC
ncbi:hypothetical protein D187_009964 [Cystobacter fuscus DSM 2262]|uniref:Uncharacterized protein n=1 Tax=Cystobacter fuscus (strain ATCC 25194 / DSM 2262 / NBRC 100088 / M29) TaxID=1242864 RepID=S9PCG1_CYSF2|nr:hypothetical protein D187_009964 [Cystobacter fuscus DSM 2262]